jgi:hypothetical protein
MLLSLFVAGVLAAGGDGTPGNPLQSERLPRTPNEALTNTERPRRERHICHHTASVIRAEKKIFHGEYRDSPQSTG